MGTDYKARLRRWGIDPEKRQAEFLAEQRRRELADLKNAWTYAREDVRAEFLAWSGVWSQMDPAASAIDPQQPPGSQED